MDVSLTAHGDVLPSSEAQPALAPETPVDPAAGSHRAVDGLAEMAFELWGFQGTSVEAETIVDHGEAARCEIEALAKRAHDNARPSVGL